MSQAGDPPGPTPAPSSSPPSTTSRPLSGEGAAAGTGGTEQETQNNNSRNEPVLPVGALIKDGRFRSNASIFFTHHYFVRGAAKDTATCVQCSRDNEAGKAKSAKYVPKQETFKTTGGNTAGK